MIERKEQKMRIKKKIYYRIKFQNISPLSIGSGESRKTDHDLLLDSRGIPFIPGTALAGVYQRLLAMDKKTNAYYFGTVKEAIGEQKQENKEEIEEQKQENRESLLLIYDGTLCDTFHEGAISVRDMVALTPEKTAIEGAKFDRQILETGKTFVTYIEQNIVDGEQDEEYSKVDKTVEVGNEIVAAFQKGEVFVGGKTSRGFGQLMAVEIHHAEFDMTNSSEVDAWLDFDMYQDSNKWVLKNDFNKHDKKDRPTRCDITLRLKQAGGISIRKYFAGLGQADYEQLTIQMKKADVGCRAKAEGITPAFSKKQEKAADVDMIELPVIPGTSWSGAFRSQMAKLNPNLHIKKSKLIKWAFGEANSKAEGESQSLPEHANKETQTEEKKISDYIGKAHLTFSESLLFHATPQEYTRNAIDRFTGGTATGALYTEKTWFDGETKLQIRYEGVPKDILKNDLEENLEEQQREMLCTLAAAVTDLVGGYLSVGGLTAVGRGIFACTEISIGKETISVYQTDQERESQQNKSNSRADALSVESLEGVYAWIKKRLVKEAE